MKRLMKDITAIMLTVAVVCAAGCTKSDEPNNVSANHNGHDYVDLGLPSGTLWATCNVGANASEEYGDYFAWGETKPKDIYDRSTYQHCNGGCNGITKYCSNAGCGNNGFIDNLITLQPEDDAATVNWGNGWYMPTRYQLEELIGFTDKTWTTQKGVNGYLFTGFNGNTLFLPAAGYGTMGTLIK